MERKAPALTGRLITTAALAALLTVGCAAYAWQKDGATGADVRRDLYQCARETGYAGGYSQSAHSLRAVGLALNGLGGPYGRPDALMEVTQRQMLQDQQAQQAKAFRDMCMEANGYRRVRVP